MISGKQQVKYSPLSLIEIIIGVTAIVGGLYIFSPFLQISVAMNGASPLIATLGSKIPVLIFGFFYLLSGLLILLGVIKGRNGSLRAGLLLHIFARFYVFLVTMLVTGILPLSWLSGVVVMAITVVCWLSHGVGGR